MSKIKIICGFPGSGKTSYIKNHIEKNDLVFDYDEIQSVITFQPKHLKNKAIHPYLVEMLKNMLKKANLDKKIKTFWVIRTVPDENFQNMLKDYDVEYFYINKTVNECLEKIMADPERKDSDKKWYPLLMDLQNEFMKGAYNICQFIND